MEDADSRDSQAGVRLFRVKARITLVDGGYMDIPFNVYGTDPNDVRQQVTKDYIMTNVSDDWGMPIRNVRVLRVSAVKRVGS
jgi:hypothetical protein